MGRTWLVLSSQCQFFVGSCGFPFVLRANGTSACHLRRNHPRRNLSPPLKISAELYGLRTEACNDDLLSPASVCRHPSLAVLPFESALNLAVGIAPFHIFTFIILLLTAGQGHLDLDFPMLKIQLERN
jgi:hypothetical protein